MLITVATVLTGLIGAGLVVLGTRYLVRPAAAADFGIPGTDTGDPVFRSWLYVKAVRDLVTGVLLLLVLAAGTSQLLGWYLLAATVIPVGDALVVRRAGGPRYAVLGIHGGTAAVTCVLAVLLLAG